MIKLLSLYTLCFSLCLTAQKSSLLWQITGTDIDTSYLMGTMHLADERILNLHENVVSAIKKSDLFILELDMQQATSPLQALKMAKAMRMPKDTFMTDILSREELLFLREKVDREIPQFSNIWYGLKPMYISMLFTEADTNVQVSTQQLALDLHLYELAKEMGKKHKGLEEVSEQLAAVDSIPLKMQAKMLLEELKDTSTISGVDQLIKVFLAQDVEVIYEMMNEYDDYPAFEKYLLVNRNYRMADRFIDFAKKKRTFAGIGAGHLGGPEGVLTLLIKKGYSIQAIEATFKP